MGPHEQPVDSRGRGLTESRAARHSRRRAARLANRGDKLDGAFHRRHAPNLASERCAASDGQRGRRLRCAGGCSMSGAGPAAYSIAFALGASPEVRSRYTRSGHGAATRRSATSTPPACERARARARWGDLRRDDLGAGYDLVLVSAICHMLGPDENRDLLRRCCCVLPLRAAASSSPTSSWNPIARRPGSRCSSP